MGDYRANIQKKNPNGGQNLSSSCLKCLAEECILLGIFKLFEKIWGFWKFMVQIWGQMLRNWQKTT